MSEYTPVETVKHAIVVREGDDSKLNAIRIDEILDTATKITHLMGPSMREKDNESRIKQM